MKLPLGKSPITSYPQYIHQLMPIINSNYGNLFYLNNYLQIFADEHYEECGNLRFREEVICINMPAKFNNCTFLPSFLDGFYHIEDFSVLFDHKNIVGILQKLLDEGYYIIINADRHSLNKSIKSGEIHDVFVYGYEDRFFHVVDFISNSGALDYAKLYFEDIHDVFQNEYEIPFFIPNIHRMIAYKIKDIEYNFNIDLAKRLLEDYVMSRNSLDCYERLDGIKDKGIWGLRCYDSCISYLLKKNSLLDMRNIYILKDHKRSVYDTICYLKKALNIGNDEMIANIQGVKRKIDICLNLCTKYNLSNDDNIIDRICEMLNDVRTNEQLAINELLNMFPS